MHPMRAFRSTAHVSLSKLAESADVPERRLSAYERGTAELDDDQLHAVADALTEFLRDYMAPDTAAIMPDQLLYLSDDCVVYGCTNRQDRVDNICSTCKTWEQSPLDGADALDVDAIPDEPTPGWEDLRACADMDREWFFLEKSEQVPPDVYRTCNEVCPVKMDCQSAAFGRTRVATLGRERFGVWGGINAGHRTLGAVDYGADEPPRRVAA